MISLKSLSTIIVVVACVLVLVMIAVRERRYYLKKRRKRQAPVVAQSDETLYSMFSQLPEADEVEYDPVGEARIYLAYGNKKMALIVLAKAAREHPERDDVRELIEEIEAAQGIAKER
jgi:Tfp pilus assembly protein FimV